MGARLRSWMQQIKQYLATTVVVVIILVLSIVLIIVEIRFNGIGFTGKTLWDWLQLLIIPVCLAIGGYWFSQVQKSNEQKITYDNQHEAALQAYIDKISELLLHEHLGESPPPQGVTIIARARTGTVLRILDPVRRVSIIQFLSQAGILAVCVENSVKGSFDSPLNNENSLGNINLQKTNLNGANLSMLCLEKANLQEASLKQTTLQGADLRGANLQKANLMHANLQKANLYGANLQGARLYGADLRGAVLIGATLEKANLMDSVISQEQLKSVKSLRGAIMPNGAKHL